MSVRADRHLTFLIFGILNILCLSVLSFVLLQVLDRLGLSLRSTGLVYNQERQSRLVDLRRAVLNQGVDLVLEWLAAERQPFFKSLNFSSDLLDVLLPEFGLKLLFGSSNLFSCF